MDIIIEFFAGVYNSFWELKTVEQFLAVISIISPAGIVAFITRRFFSKEINDAKAEIKLALDLRDSAIAKQERLEGELKTARDECETAERNSAASALAMYKREIKQGNSSKGFHVLNDHFIENRPVLSQMAVELAELHFSQGDFDAPQHYVAGLHYANLAVELDGNNADAPSLAAELAEMVKLETEGARLIRPILTSMYRGICCLPERC